jgi:hypothetical protein
METAETGGKVKMATTMSVTHHSGERIWLGGIVDVEEVVSAARALIEPLLQDQHAYWDKRIGRTPGSTADRVRIAESYYINPCFERDG